MKAKKVEECLEVLEELGAEKGIDVINESLIMHLQSLLRAKKEIQSLQQTGETLIASINKKDQEIESLKQQKEDLKEWLKEQRQQYGSEMEQWYCFDNTLDKINELENK